MKNEADIYPLVESIWCEMLGVERARPNDSFFDFAGTSIAAERIASRICEVFPVSVNGSDVMRRETLSKVVSFVASMLP